MKSNIILHGDALTKLKELPDESIDCVMTSPPYWALRDYGDGNSQIWDGDENCEHEFEIKERQIHSGTLDVSKTVHHALKVGALKTDWKTKDGFCNKCGAWKGQLGLEPTFEQYINDLCDIFDEVKRVLKNTGTCWVNLGDTYYTKSGSGFLNDNLTKTDTHVLNTGINKANELRGQPHKYMQSKSLVLIPQRFQIEMVNRGWICRNTIIWHKPNCMPSSVKDRFTVDFEYIFFFTKNKKYFFETQYEPNHYDGRKVMVAKRKKTECYRDGIPRWANLEKGRNKRAVWRICPKPFKESHFAVFPEELVETPLNAGCPKGGVVLDPFFGAGTTGLVALKQSKKFIGIELNEEYIKIANARLKPFLEQEKLK